MLTRREFNQQVASITGAFLLADPPVGMRVGDQLRVNGARLLASLAELAEFGKTPEGGVSRVAYSDADLAARSFVIELMRAAALDVSIDVAGNIVGRRDGRVPGLAPIMCGSHIDSVPEGGNFDGQVGSMAAIEVAHTLADDRFITRHPLEVVIFQNEEGGKTGSRLMSGEVADHEFDLVTRSGKTIAEGIAALGGDPGRLEQARRRRGDVAAYLELHVEQGSVLDRSGVTIGVVEGIVGIKRWTVTVDGFANHAGTTPMDSRQDALLAAAQFIEAVHRVTRETPGTQVGTVGQIAVSPGAPNVIPGRVQLSLEVRDLSMSRIDQLFEALADGARTIGRRTGTTFGFEQFYVSRAAPTDPRIRDLIADAARELRLRHQRMPSGAGHDAQSIALFAPVGMVFVPSAGGISHSPLEFSEPEHVVAGADVLLHATLAADLREWQ